MIELMAATDGVVRGEKRRPGKREIADGIEHLVADELVWKAGALGVENAVIAHHESIFEGGAERIARVPKSRYVAHEAEGARASDLAAESVRADVNSQALAADQRMIELDLCLDAKAVFIRCDLADRITESDAYRPEHLDIPTRGLEHLDADIVDFRNERRGAAVHDRCLGSVDLHHRVIDVKSRKRSKDVLRGRNERPRFVAQHGRKFRCGHRAHVRSDLADLPAIDAGTNEPKSSTGVRGM